MAAETWIEILIETKYFQLQELISMFKSSMKISIKVIWK